VELVQDIGSFDVAIVDMSACAEDPGGDSALDGKEAIRALRKAEPALGIVAHGERPERHLANSALQAGASAYLARTAAADLLQRAVNAALAQERFIDPAVPPPGRRGKLTRRQREILQLLADGGSSAFAARELGLSEETVKTHTKNVLARLGARNRTHAVAIALRESLIE
jgi:DNA-binding NarL/FixJ family response regulator